jgi:RNA polymerase sigma-70 factor, ECF subfamily
VEAVFRSHGGQVWRAIVAMTAGRVDIADDVTAEAFSRLLSYEKSVRDPVAWVFRVAFRLAAAELRREQHSSHHASTDPGQSDRVVLSGELAAALRSLSPAHRVVVFLHYYADLPVSEVAALTGSTRTAVKVQLHRARRALRGALEAEEATGG